MKTSEILNDVKENYLSVEIGEFKPTKKCCGRFGASSYYFTIYSTDKYIYVATGTDDDAEYFKAKILGEKTKVVEKEVIEEEPPQPTVTCEDVVDGLKRDKDAVEKAIAEIVALPSAEDRFMDILKNLRDRINIIDKTIEVLSPISHNPETDNSQIAKESENNEKHSGYLDFEFKDEHSKYIMECGKKQIEDLNERELQVLAASITSHRHQGGDFSFLDDTLKDLKNARLDFSMKQLRGYLSQLIQKDYIWYCDEYTQINICKKAKNIDADIELIIPELY